MQAALDCCLTQQMHWSRATLALQKLTRQLQLRQEQQ
jgi:hypothetical protein